MLSRSFSELSSSSSSFDNDRCARIGFDWTPNKLISSSSSSSSDRALLRIIIFFFFFFFFFFFERRPRRPRPRLNAAMISSSSIDPSSSTSERLARPLPRRTVASSTSPSPVVSVSTTFERRRVRVRLLRFFPLPLLPRLSAAMMSSSPIKSLLSPDDE